MVSLNLKYYMQGAGEDNQEAKTRLKCKLKLKARIGKQRMCDIRQGVPNNKT